MKFGYVKSVLDGTEKEFSPEIKSELPVGFSYDRFLPDVLDQGNESICVPCSISSWLNWKINLSDGQRRENNINLYRIYDIRKDKESEGMQIKEALSYLKKEKDIQGYAKIGGILSLKYAIFANGPCIGGLSVYNTERSSFWKKDSSEYLGGHAIAIVGYSEDSLIIRNSWGKGFGDNGYCYMPYSDFSEFLELWTIY